MLDCTAIRADLHDRLDSARNLIASTHPPGVPDVSREARGLAVVLIYAAHEQLVVSFCRALLEVAASLRVGNRRLRPGLQVFAAYPQLQSTNAVTPTAIWRGRGLDVIRTVGERKVSTISPEVFPNDGSQFRRAQVTTMCKLFELDDPGPILKEVWDRLDTIVTERNQVAHGAMTADEVGRLYTQQDLLDLVDLWETRWNEFLDAAEAKGATRDFYRAAR